MNLNLVKVELMKYDIIFPTAFDSINPDNDNIDVLVQTENGQQYTFVVATPFPSIATVALIGFPSPSYQ